MAATVSTATAIAPLRLSSTGVRARAAVRSCLQFGHLARPSPRPQSRRSPAVDPLAGPSSSGRGSVRCRGAVRMVGESEFGEEVLGSELPVLAEFVAEWCGPCRLISPIIDWASEEYKGRLKIVKIDHDANPQLIEEYKVYGLPCLILFSNGQAVPESQREGAITKAKLKEYLDSLLNPTTVV